MPVQDMDPLFALVGGTARNPQLAVCPGYAAPLNSGWMALAPSCATARVTSVCLSESATPMRKRDRISKHARNTHV